ncbi:choice-of-anchor J domain-containing protein [Flavobacterium sp. UBA7682]|uniref:choice-of-anchor J domain-containing protein n=1 Tax=Flavobacterium sp. UBA7682 TaxID=1946560 RepID=UPI0025C6F403|nr:choice-of-anchor J domain-containing protein [Flavobacterium sp. UBA7682]
MKIKFLKTMFLLVLTSSVLTSCVGDDDYVIPTVYDYHFSEGFGSSPIGGGSNEVAIALEGWVNYNATATRLWHARAFSNNTYAEFSSFYSAAGTNDTAWLITPAIDLTTTSGEILSFVTKTRFENGYPLTAFVSTDYDGTTAGIATATWEPITFTTPTVEDVFVNSGNIDLSAYNSNNVRIAFKYTGSKSGVTTTLQLDNIKISKN